MWHEVGEIQPPSKSAKEAGYNRILKYKRSEWRCLGQWDSRDKAKEKGEEEILQKCPVLRIVFMM